MENILKPIGMLCNALLVKDPNNQLDMNTKK